MAAAWSTGHRDWFLPLWNHPTGVGALSRRFCLAGVSTPGFSQEGRRGASAALQQLLVREANPSPWPARPQIRPNSTLGAKKQEFKGGRVGNHGLPGVKPKRTQTALSRRRLGDGGEGKSRPTARPRWPAHSRSRETGHPGEQKTTEPAPHRFFFFFFFLSFFAFFFFIFFFFSFFSFLSFFFVFFVFGGSFFCLILISFFFFFFLFFYFFFFLVVFVFFSRRHIFFYFVL